ncbi:hypothetical protein TNIN_263301 [Trichonephila inaurata madagascariensis]|uniref:Uncharacterized protein n=1 Tax=Trichonephila inaurata madagascariensis TaxID=2747483 RepID=A0A8X6Y2D7_9ARAC|nr:hypothetical protein TNIN_263301 [Trichonephila inaurata madagascariensis]
MGTLVSGLNFNFYARCVTAALLTPPGTLIGHERRKIICSIHAFHQPVSHSADMPIPDLRKKYEIVKGDVEEEFIRPWASQDPDVEAEDLNEPAH